MLLGYPKKPKKNIGRIKKRLFLPTVIMKKTSYITAGLMTVYFLRRLYLKNRKTPIFHCKIPFNYNAFALYPVGIFIDKSQQKNKRLLAHEKKHWEQFKKLGILRVFWEYITNNYDENPLETEARIAAGEKKECLTNYTDCVRTGRSFTVNNKNFRK